MKNNIFKTKPYRLWRTISCWRMLEGGIRAVSDVATGEPPWSNGYIHSHPHAEGPDAVKSQHQNKTKKMGGSLEGRRGEVDEGEK